MTTLTNACNDLSSGAMLAPEINKAIRQLIWTLSFDVDPDEPDKLVKVADRGYREKLRALVDEMVSKASQ